MGGAIAVRVAAAGVVPLLVGLVVIDVVEGKCTPRCHKVYSRKSSPTRSKQNPGPFFSFFTCCMPVSSQVQLLTRSVLCIVF